MSSQTGGSLRVCNLDYDKVWNLKNPDMFERKVFGPKHEIVKPIYREHFLGLFSFSSYQFTKQSRASAAVLCVTNK